MCTKARAEHRPREKGLAKGEAGQLASLLKAYAPHDGSLFGNPPSRDIAQLREQAEVF